MKIQPLENLVGTVRRIRDAGKTIVLCHGVFDLLHIGHIRHFTEAKSLGDVLVVTLTADQFVNKGPLRPAFHETMRAEAIAALDCVDYVAINPWPTAVETIAALKPHKYIKGPDYKVMEEDHTGGIIKEKQAIEALGGRLVFTDGATFSSTHLINRYLSNLPKELEEYLTLFRNRFQTADLMATLDQTAKLRVLVIGDTILDDYHYCEAIGKSSKDPTLALRYKSHDLFAGGVLSVANHVANFAAQVDLVTVLGEDQRHEAFIRSQLRSNISPLFFTRPNAPTLIKRRFIDGYSFNKIFEVYIMDDSELPDAVDSEMVNHVASHLPEYDLVIVSDYGHGTISRPMIGGLCDAAPFLCVNTQANAGNRGFHTISHYPRADYACIAQHELLLERRSRNGSTRIDMQAVTRQLGCDVFMVTLGRNGCAVMDQAFSFIQVPAFADKVVDRVGAGDAVFALTAMCAQQQAPLEVLGFIGNIVGSMAVETIGNKKPIDRPSVYKAIEALMK